MYNRLEMLLNESNYDEAEKELQKCLTAAETDTGENDVLAILAASIYWHKAEYEKCYGHIKAGLKYNYCNYELYLMLGNYYELTNPDQAWLCYQNAEFYCKDEEDLEVIRNYRLELELKSEIHVSKISIVILSYNSLEYTKQCIESIRKNNSEKCYEIIVVDNASQDGSAAWLEAQKDIQLIVNKENMGFPYGCNQGIKRAEPENDIFLLNDDTVLMPNSLFWLRMGLYENLHIGATGSVSNYVSNGQRIEEGVGTLEQCIEYGIRNNIPMRHPYEKKVFLVGFALLLRRAALDEVGLLDIRFTPGTFEDEDIAIRLQQAGWKIILCKNSFIYHYGSGGGANAMKWRELSAINSAKFHEKWNFDLGYYSCARTEIIGLIQNPAEDKIHVLEIGCGMGATLAEIQSHWPNSEVKGIELVPGIAKIGANIVDIIQGDAEHMDIPFEKCSFDYIILGDVLEHLMEPQKMLMRLKEYLKMDGAFVCSVPNMMHMSVILPLLQGMFNYADAGILDRTHIRFFTLASIYEMFQECKLEIEDIGAIYTVASTDEKNIQAIKAIQIVFSTASLQQFQAYQYIFRAKRQ
ncbi:MAG: glycosyltransferase [Lachnospiraceae bacterium]|nr:glycosyltransferase [Lachnospiraceae bacterium]